MRQVQVAEVEGHVAELVAEAEAGGSVTLMRDGKAVAQIVPFAGTGKPEFTAQEREAARVWLNEAMEKGLDLGGKWEGRDVLYERE